MPSAYYVPTPEAALTAIAARSLQGLGCANCANTSCAGCVSGLGQFFPRLPAIARSAKLAFYLPGVQSPAQLTGLRGIGDRLPPMLGRLSRLGAGAGDSSRFNRAVARGMYALPFQNATAQGNAGLGRLGQISVDPTLLLGGIGLLALGMFLLGGKHMPKIRQRRAARLRRRLRELEG